MIDRLAQKKEKKEKKKMSLAKLTKICQRQQRHSGVDFKKVFFFFFSPPVAGNLPCLCTARKREKGEAAFLFSGLGEKQGSGGDVGG